MSLRSWFRSLFTRPAARTIRRAPRRARLTLEALEGRWCPSTITVLNIGDAPGALTYTGTDPSTGTANYTAPTLRAAIDGANAMAGADTINFDTRGVFATAQTINLGGMQLELTDTTGATTITGPVALTDTTGAPTITGLGVTVNGGGLSRVFQVDNMVTASISGLTISGGMAAGTSGNGGGLANFGNTTLSNCIISENSAGYLSGGVYGGAASTTTLNDCIVSGNSAVFGGGLDSHGTLTLSKHCTVSNNSATTDGGALENYLGTTTLTDCTFSGNKSTNGGGGLFLNGGQTTLTNCTVSGNTATSGAGGGLLNGGTATLDNCVICSNTARGYGGGIRNAGTITLTDCTVSGNTTTIQSGGGMYNTGTTTLTDCTVSGNHSANRGGGLSDTGGTTTLTNCTITGNSASTNGGGVNSNNNAGVGTTTLVNCTVSGNSTSGSGGGVSVIANTVTLTNSIVAGNTATGSGPDVYGAMNSQGYNLIGKTDRNSSGWVGTDLKGTDARPIDPLLAPLGSYGGPTQTMPLLPGSPALDAGSNGLIPTGVTTDQRGSVPFTGTLTSGSAAVTGLVSTTGLHVGQAVAGTGVASGTTILTVNSTDNTITLSRNATGNGSSNLVASYPRIVNGTVDIGAFESGGFTIVVTSGSNQTTKVNTAFAAPLVVTVTANNALEPVAGGQVTFTKSSKGSASAVLSSSTATIGAETIGPDGRRSGTASVTATATAATSSYSFTATTTGISDLANLAIFYLTNKK